MTHVLDPMSGQVPSIPQGPPSQASDKAQPDICELTGDASLKELPLTPTDKESKSPQQVTHALISDTGRGLRADEHQSGELTTAAAGKEWSPSALNRSPVQEDSCLDSATDSDDDDEDNDDDDDDFMSDEDEESGEREACARRTQSSTSAHGEDTLADAPGENFNGGFTASAPASLTTSMLDID